MVDDEVGLMLVAATVAIGTSGGVPTDKCGRESNNFMPDDRSTPRIAASGDRSVAASVNYGFVNTGSSAVFVGRDIVAYNHGRFDSAHGDIEQKNLLLTEAEAALGPDHPEVAERLSDLATAYRDQGRTSEAIPLLQRAMTISEAALGPDHPEVAERLSDLAT
ncbi:tetratricopeptide repeat protein, partial [Micromonospora sp. LOL_013]|uniref:tetratricopeptide repeat protein n=1 Tax=Micromonospora sp. LOL_013 TaxID=3345414 RepID=UPI003A88950A